MGLLNAAAAAVWRRLAPQARTTEAADPAGTPSRVIYVGRPEAGVVVTPDTALTYSAVYACVRVIAETIGTLTWHTFIRDGESKKRANDWVTYILRDRPNPETTAVAWREQMVASALLWGNGYAEIETDLAGRVQGLWQIAPDRVQVDRTSSGRLVYVVSNRFQPDAVLDASQVFHLKGLSFDGLVGYSPIRLATRSISIGMAADRFAGSFFGNGTWLGGVLQSDKALSEVAMRNLRESWLSMFRGADRAHSPAILEEGIKYQPLGIPPQDAQLIDQRRFQIEEICRWYRVPPHKISDLTRATYSNIESQEREFVHNSIMPWVIKLEQEADFKLFGHNRQGFFTKLNVASLLRGNIEDRYKAYSIARLNGWLSANEIREMEDMNSIGSQGDIYLVPTTHVNAKSAMGVDEKSEEADEGPGNRRLRLLPSPDNLRSAHRDLIATAMGHVARREGKVAAKLRSQHEDPTILQAEARAWLQGENYQVYRADAVWPAVLACARTLGPLDAATESLLRDRFEFVMDSRDVLERILAGVEITDELEVADRLVDAALQVRLSVAA